MALILETSGRRKRSLAHRSATEMTERHIISSGGCPRHSFLTGTRASCYPASVRSCNRLHGSLRHRTRLNSKRTEPHSTTQSNYRINHPNRLNYLDPDPNPDSDPPPRSIHNLLRTGHKRKFTKLLNNSNPIQRSQKGPRHDRVRPSRSAVSSVGLRQQFKTVSIKFPNTKRCETPLTKKRPTPALQFKTVSLNLQTPKRSRPPPHKKASCT